MTLDAHHHSALPLDEGLYRLESAEITFFKQQTGIDDDDELKTHLLSIQAEAYEVTLFLFLFTWPFSDPIMQGVSISLYTPLFVGKV